MSLLWPFMVNRNQNVPLITFKVALLLKCAILPYKCHSPSLLQHVGEVELQPGNRAACVGLGIVMRVGFSVDARA